MIDDFMGTEPETYEAPENACRRCRERGKDWSGGDPECGFTSGVFSPDNWNCATLNALRDLAEQTRCYGDDHSAGLIFAGDVSDYLLLRWYKNRGATAEAYYWGDNGLEPLTLAKAEAVLADAERWGA